MNIREDSKKIIQFFLKQAIKCGDLRREFLFQYDDLSVKMNLQDGNYCRVCCQYLNELGYIHLYSCASESNPDCKDMEIRIEARAIDFLESPN